MFPAGLGFRGQSIGESFMAITVTNVNTLSLLNILNRTSAAQSQTLTRLSTGSRINAGRDDPAGLISMRGLETELAAVDAAISNNQRTDAMLNVADKSLTEVASLLNEIKDLAIASANEDGISADELAANQSQVDEAISAIDRIIGTTEFNGKKLLDGSLAIQTTGVDTTKISDLKVYSRDPDSDTSLTVSVSSAAEKAQLQIATTSATDATSISVQGKDGVVVIDIASGDNLSAVAASINAATAQTGVAASAAGGDLTLLSSDYGSAAFVRVSVVTDTTDTSFTGGSDDGVDASVTVNGQSTAVDGLQVGYSAGGVSLTFNLTEDYNDGTVSGDETFTVSSSSGGATFQMGTTATTRSTIGIDGLYSHQLGSAVLGYLSSLKGGGTNSLVNDPNQAAQIASEAAEQVAKAQGRVGGFLKFQVGTALNQQNATRESLTSALSTIKDVDYATETAELSRQNILMQASMSLLGLAQQQSSQVLSLLQ
jgi:flagellin-like hook-associated protein FlgL